MLRKYLLKDHNDLFVNNSKKQQHILVVWCFNMYLFLIKYHSVCYIHELLYLTNFEEPESKHVQLWIVSVNFTPSL